MTISPDNDIREILYFIWELLKYIFTNIEAIYCTELNIIRSKIDTIPPKVPTNPIIIDFREGVEMLQEYNPNISQSVYSDLNTLSEKEMGRMIKEKYDSDLFILVNYPTNARPFYTMPNKDDPTFSNSFDIIFKGNEISSGSQRINDYEDLKKSIVEKNFDLTKLEYYTNAFMHGCKKHGGCGFGLERIVSLYLDLGNVKRASFCPRDPDRLVP